MNQVHAKIKSSPLGKGKITTEHHHPSLMLAVIAIQVYWWCIMACYFHDYIDHQVLLQFLYSIDIGGNINPFVAGFGAFFISAIVFQALGCVIYYCYLQPRTPIKLLQQHSIILTGIFTALFIIPTPNDVTLVYLFNVIRALLAVPLVAISMKGILRKLLCSFVAFGMGICMAFFSLLIIGYLPEMKQPLAWDSLQGIRYLCSIFPAILLLGSLVIVKMVAGIKKFQR